jgi:hypothetical protein
MLKSTAFLFACIALAESFIVQERAVADSAIRIFDVDVYLNQQPQCTLGPATPIKASVSPFKPQVDLGDLITELARKGAEAGGKLVYGIKLVSFIPYQGAIATATASTCADARFLPFSASLLGTMSRATSVRGFSFNDGVPGALRSVSTSKLSSQPLKDDSSIAKLRSLILSPEMFDLSPVFPSCPFIPTFGFEMKDEANTVWWLVSESCRTAELASPDTDWRQTPLIKLNDEAISQFRALFASDAPK